MTECAVAPESEKEGKYGYENPTFHEKCSYLECNFWRNVHIVKL